MPTQTRAEINRDHLHRRRAGEDAKAQQWVAAYTQHLAGEGDYPGAPPPAARLQVAQLRLAKVRADQQAKIDRWGHQPNRRRPPSAVDDFAPVRQARRAVERAEVLDADLRARRRAEDEAIAAALAARQASTRTPHRSRTDTRRNMTDPHSRALSLRGGGWIQGYNCQAVTSSDGLIIATMVTNVATDTPHLIPMMDKAVAAATHIHSHQPEPPQTPGIGLLLADAGYHSEANITAAGPDRLIASAKAHKLRAARAERAATEDPSPPLPESDPETSPMQAMAARLLTDEGHAAYSKRSHIAETPFGWAKHTLGFRRFTGRGLARADAEFTFHAMVNNLCKALTSGHLATI